jgi:hypothetical protein
MELAEAIEKHNALAFFPIIVNRNMEVQDGQHRLKAAELLGVPVYYFIAEHGEVEIEHVPGIAGRTREWTLDDYLWHHVQNGKTEYLKLNEFYQKYRIAHGDNFLSLSKCMQLCNFGSTLKQRDRFIAGEYECNDVIFANIVARSILDFQPYIKHWNHGAFVDTIGNLTGNAAYDHGRMMAKMAYLGPRLIKCPDVASYIAVMSEMYNHRHTADNCIELRQIYAGDPGHRVDRKDKFHDIRSANRRS